MPLVDGFKQLNDDLTGTPPTFGSYRYAYPIALSERNAIQIWFKTMDTNI